MYGEPPPSPRAISIFCPDATGLFVASTRPVWLRSTPDGSNTSEVSGGFPLTKTKSLATCLVNEPGSLLAPTVITRRPAPGEPIVASPSGVTSPGLPLLLAEATIVTPASVALSQATEVGKSGLLPAGGALPKLRLITCGTGFG